VAKDSLTFWRLAVAAGLLFLVGGPLAAPFLELLQPEAWQAWSEVGRLLRLAANTLALVAGAVALALPLGTAAAILFHRTNLPLQTVWRLLTVFLLFVPLPVLASAWQAALGSGGWLPLPVWGGTTPGDPDVAPTGLAWKPWAHGLGAAIFVHAVAGFPWVVWIVGQGLGWVERELEEDALTVAGVGTVVLRVTLPRCRATLGAAALWIALQAATEITVTDVMQVSTLAEEVYTQMVAGDTGGLARSVALALPGAVLGWVILAVVVVRLEKTLPALESWSSAPLVWELGKCRWMWFTVVALGMIVLAGIPVGGLVWKAGLAGNPPGWSAATMLTHLQHVGRLRGLMVGESLGLAVATGIVCAGLGLLAAWLGGSRWFSSLLLLLMAGVWAFPAPVLGLGLKKTIEWLIAATGSGLLATALYYGPSYLPVFWAHLVRFLPFALVLVWPLVRLIPRDLREAADVDGLRPGQQFRALILPLAFPAVIQAALAVAILSLGEVAAGKLVETPGSQTMAHEIFNIMHYGVPNDLAALCLVLLGLVALGGLALAGVRRLFPAFPG
jgi:iron(III) transport system permease protein